MAPAIARCGRQYASVCGPEGPGGGDRESAPLVRLWASSRRHHARCTGKRRRVGGQIDAGVTSHDCSRARGEIGRARVTSTRSRSSGKRIAVSDRAVGSIAGRFRHGQPRRKSRSSDPAGRTGSTTGRDFDGNKVLSAWATVPATGWRVSSSGPRARPSPLSAERSGDGASDRRLRRGRGRALDPARPPAGASDQAYAGGGGGDRRGRLRRADRARPQGRAGCAGVGFQPMAEQVQDLIERAGAESGRAHAGARGRLQAQVRVPGEHVARASGRR